MPKACKDGLQETQVRISNECAKASTWSFSLLPAFHPPISS